MSRTWHVAQIDYLRTGASGRKRRHSEYDNPQGSGLARRSAHAVWRPQVHCDEENNDAAGDEDDVRSNEELSNMIQQHQRRIGTLEEVLAQLLRCQNPHIATVTGLSSLARESLRLSQHDKRVPGSRSSFRDFVTEPGSSFPNASVQSIKPVRPAADGKILLPIDFQSLDDAFGRLETNSMYEELSGPEDDDDLAIRVVAFGWAAAARIHTLDTVWRFIRTFDRLVTSYMGQVEQLAALKAVRALLIHKIRPRNQPLRPIPKFYAPTRLQQERKHPSQIDYFAWPSVRDYLIKNNDKYDIRSIPQLAHTTFANACRFDWPYKLGDTYLTTKASGQLVLTAEFMARYHDLRCWQIDIHDDKRLIPAYLQLDCGLLAQYQDLRQTDERAGDAVYLAPKNWSHGLEYPLAGQVLTLPRSQDGVLDNCTTESTQNEYTQAVRCDRTRSSQDVGLHSSMMPAPLPDEWSWVSDATRPGYGSMQSLLNAALPL